MYDFHGIFAELHQFCNSDLSAFYFEIRKDTYVTTRGQQPDVLVVQ